MHIFASGVVVIHAHPYVKYYNCVKFSTIG